MAFTTRALDINLSTTTLAPTIPKTSLPSTRLFDSAIDKLPTVNLTKSLETKGLDFAAASKQQTRFTGYTAPNKPTNIQPTTVRLTSSLSTPTVQPPLFKDDSLSWSAISNNTKPVIGTTTLSGRALDSAYSPTKFTNAQAPTTKLGLSTSSFDTLVKGGYFDAPLSPSKLVVDANSGSVLSGSSFNKLVDAGIYNAPLSPTRLVGPAQDLSPTRVLGDAQITKYEGPSIFGDNPPPSGPFVGPVHNTPVTDYKGPSILDPSIRNPTEFVGPVQNWTPSSYVSPPVLAAQQLVKTANGTFALASINNTNSILSTANTGVLGASNVANPYQTNTKIMDHREEVFDHRFVTALLNQAQGFSSKVLADALASSGDVLTFGANGAGAYAAHRVPLDVHYS